MPDLTASIIVNPITGSADAVYQLYDIVKVQETSTEWATWNGTEWLMPINGPGQSRVSFLHILGAPFTAAQVNEVLKVGDADPGVLITKRLWGATALPASVITDLMNPAKQQSTLTWADLKDAVRLKSNNRKLRDQDIPV